MKRTFLQFGSSVLLSVFATAPLHANNPFDVTCTKGCSSCSEGSDCGPESDTNTVQQTFPASEATAKDAYIAQMEAQGYTCTVTQSQSTQSSGSSTPRPAGVTVDSYDRGSLTFSGISPDQIKKEDGKPRQMEIKNRVVDYSDTSDGFQVRTYWTNQLPAPGSNGIRSIPATVQPITTTVYRDPDGDKTTSSGILDVVHTQRHPQSGVELTRTSRITSPPGNSAWKREYFLGDPKTTTGLLAYREINVAYTEHTDGSATAHEVTNDRASDGTLVITSDVTKIYQYYKYGFPVVIKETKHTGTGSDYVSEWTYYYDRKDQASFNKPRTLRQNDGKWANYTYTGSLVTGVLVTKTVSGWLDNPAPATIETAPDENANRVVTEIEARYDTGTFGREEKIAGVLVSKSWGERFKDNSGQLVEKSHVETGTSTLLTIKTAYANDESVSAIERGRVKSIQHPDGTVELYRYQVSGTNRVETYEKGAGSLDGVTAGKRTISTYTGRDILIKVIEIDIASGVELSAKEAIAFNANGKPTRWAYNNDPADYTETIYGCCGIDSQRSRDGIVTTYTHDALKRPLTSVSLGITTSYAYGKKITGGIPFPKVTITKTAGMLTQVVETVVNDYAGNVIERISPDLDGDSNEEVTSIVRDVTSRTTTTNNPDGGTEIEVSYTDGQNKSRGGTAVVPEAWTFATHGEQGGGLVTTEFAGTASSTRWTKSYANLKGGIFKTTVPGSSGEVAIQTNIFDASGRLSASSDGDGVTALAAYNTEGERYRTAIDLNQNGQIDDSDRVRDTLEDVVQDSPVGAAFRVRNVIFDLSNNPVTVSTTYRSVDGLKNRTETLGGGVTASIQAAWVDRADGEWTDTTVAPDSTKSAVLHSAWRSIGQFRLDTSNNVIESKATVYDALGRVATQSDSRKTTVTTRTAYNSAGMVTSVTEDLTTGTDRGTSFGYDSMGRRTATTLPDNTVKYASYWPTGQVKAEWGSLTYPTVKIYSAQGELVELRTWRSGAPVTPDESSTGFDKTTWSYNDRGQMSAKLYADNKGPSYTYTAGGRLHTRTWARGVVTNYGYNSAGELTSKDYSDSTPDMVIAFDKLGRQTSISNGVAQSVFSFDSSTLRLDTETVSYNVDGAPGFEFSRVLDRSNDSLGRDAGFALKNGTTVENQAVYGYSETTGRLETVTGPGGTYTYGYVPGSILIASVTGPAHTVINTWFSDRDALQLKENKIGSTVVSSFDYGVNAIGQRSGVAQTGTAFSSTRSIAWGYDGLGQVVSADSSEAGHDRTYLYDTIGNRKKSADSLILPASENYTTNPLNQYTAVAVVTPSYDDDGNAIAYPVPTNTSSNSTLLWDGENRMIGATVLGTTTSYVYDAQSRRIAKITGSNIELELYDGWNCIARYAGGLLSKRYLWGMDLSGRIQEAGGAGGLLAVGEGSEIHYPTFDGNGNVSEYLRDNGTEAAHFEYDAFGRAVLNTDASGLFDIRFSTKSQDTEMGFLYYGYRSYDPMIGRWLSRDPIGENGGINEYAFVNNGATNVVDRLGLNAYSPSPPSGWEMDGGLTHTGGGQIVLGFMGDFITYNKWKYKGKREIEGACGEEIKGKWIESSGWSFSMGQTTTAGGGVNGGVGGHEGAPSAGANIEGNISKSLGLTASGGLAQEVEWKCSCREKQKATAVIKASIEEVAGTYTDYHFFSGTDYEFHAHMIQLKGWDCKYKKCDQ